MATAAVQTVGLGLYLVTFAAAFFAFSRGDAMKNDALNAGSFDIRDGESYADALGRAWFGENHGPAGVHLIGRFRHGWNSYLGRRPTSERLLAERSRCAHKLAEERFKAAPDIVSASEVFEVSRARSNATSEVVHRYEAKIGDRRIHIFLSEDCRWAMVTESE